MLADFDRDTLVEYAQNSIDKGSKSFALASQIFDPEMREHILLFYAWCRRCDDITDGQDHGRDTENDQRGYDAKSRKAANARIAILRNKTDAALAGKMGDDKAFDALAILVQECQIDQRYIDDIIDGFALDADEWRPRSEDDLYQYCYHVAGAVGVIMAQIMGVDDEEVMDRACDLGIAFQLANIARDIGEDDSNDRCYIPIEWLVERDIEPGEHMRPHYRTDLTELAARMCHKSAQYSASARYGANALPFRARWAIVAASDIYGGIAEKILAAGESAWDQRVYTSKAEKLWRLSRSFFDATQDSDTVSRDGLWTRPRH